MAAELRGEAMSIANPLERLMLDLINEERRAAGLAPLQLELRLNDAAEDHSQWMIDTDNFGHTGAGGSSPWDRMEDAEFEFSGRWSAAENIAWQSVRGEPGLEDDVEDLHEALMDSPGHRANIMSANSEVVGVGIERGDFRGWDALFVTQNFASTDAPLQIDGDAAPPPPPSEPDSPPEPPAAPAPPPPADDPVAAPPRGGSKIEIGTETVFQSSPDRWHTVVFEERIDDAVVVMGPVSNNGGDAVTVRVRNVTDTGFQFQLDEWEYQDGTHARETVSWMAVSDGVHQLADGRTIMAGSGASDHRGSRVTLGESFDQVPVVFTQVASDRGPDTVTSRVEALGADSFRFRLQEEEAEGSHTRERVDWVAIESGGRGDLAAGKVGGVTHRGSTIDHDADQALFAHMQTSNELDTANIRYDPSGNRSRIWVDEEMSRDPEIWHARETVGIMTADLGVYDLFA